MPRKFMKLAILATIACTANPALAQQSASKGSPLIDFPDFLKIAGEVAPYRQKRLLSISDFTARAAEKDVLLLDARSAAAFSEGHMKGAVNLPLPDFNAESLKRLIGDKPDREILIYCNNNFRDNIRPVPTKARPLALNIGTFINLYGYGYKNVYELGEATLMSNPQLAWTSTPQETSQP